MIRECPRLCPLSNNQRGNLQVLVIGYMGLVIHSLEAVSKPLIDPREKEETFSAQAVYWSARDAISK